MKKVGILTVHRSLNMGSFLQSFALNKYLTMNNVEVYQLDNHSREPKYSLKVLVKYTIKDMSFKRWNFYNEMSKKFVRQLEYFNQIDFKDKQVPTLDGVILGSDEIWNIRRDEMKRYTSFWGEDINNENVYSYAPSINTSTAEELKQLDFVLPSLANLKKISVRDHHTYREISKLVPERHIEIVVDPTWLLEFEDYLLDKDISLDINEEFVLIYAWEERITQAEKKVITQFAKENNLKIVAVCLFISWADYNIPADAFSFQSYVDKASYIVTNTFHGTVFSILSNTSFVTLGKENTKVIEALNSVGLQDREVNEDTICSVLKDEIDWDKINNNIYEIRAHSQKFIDTILFDMDKS